MNPSKILPSIKELQLPTPQIPLPKKNPLKADEIWTKAFQEITKDISVDPLKLKGKRFTPYMPPQPQPLKKGGPCSECNVVLSPAWRKGFGEKPLCNGCGIRYIKKIKKKS